MGTRAGVWGCVSGPGDFIFIRFRQKTAQSCGLVSFQNGQVDPTLVVEKKLSRVLLTSDFEGRRKSKVAINRL